MAVSLVAAARYALQFPKLAALAARLFLDPRVSPLLKFGALASALVVISPVDLFGDIPVLGPIDDLALLMLIVNVFVRLAPAALVREHSARVGWGPDISVTEPARSGAGTQIKNVTPR